jgi:hypothetical protein
MINSKCDLTEKIFLDVKYFNIFLVKIAKFLNAFIIVKKIIIKIIVYINIIIYLIIEIFII